MMKNTTGLVKTVTITLTTHEADFIAKQLTFLAKNYCQGSFASRQLAKKIDFLRIRAEAS